MKNKKDRIRNILKENLGDIIVYPKDIEFLVKEEDPDLTSFDLEQIKQMILRAMADGKIVERKDIPLFINVYMKSTKNLN